MGGVIRFGLAEVDMSVLEGHRRTETWDHNGRCSCNRKTYLFGQCQRCVADEAAGRFDKPMWDLDDTRVVPLHQVEPMRPEAPAILVTRSGLAAESIPGTRIEARQWKSGSLAFSETNAEFRMVVGSDIAGVYFMIQPCVAVKFEECQGRSMQVVV